MSKGICLYGVLILGDIYAMCSLPAGHSEEWRNTPTVQLKNGHRLMNLDGYYVNAPYWCGHCGRPMGDTQGGYAVVRNTRVCHPNMPTMKVLRSGTGTVSIPRPDCYRLITVYGEVLGGRSHETQTG